MLLKIQSAYSDTLTQRAKKETQENLLNLVIVIVVRIIVIVIVIAMCA